ncbi:energy transducer TonB [Flavobacterium sp. H4147]|uniref:energy transducer TonB n=1 Tax=Flavobacterium sp. H4147 TaxID=3034149 RepID=UPI0023EBCDD4|nr:energy transducer TonB [Flavobacterium sp. H4147]
MKKLILFLFLSFFAQKSVSQNTEQLSAIQKQTYELKTVQVAPEFIGGEEKFVEYINMKFKKPKEDKQITGTIYCNFIVDMDGSIRKVVITKDLGKKIGKQLIKVLEKSPKWLPGEHEGYHVKTKIEFSFDVN